MFTYIIFSLIILLAIVIIAKRVYKVIKGKGSACSCCSKKTNCSSIKKVDH